MRPLIRPCLVWLLPSLLLVPLSGGCGNHDTSTTGESSPAASSKECAAYLSVYGSCMRRLSPDDPTLADARTEMTRHSLAAMTDPDLLRKTCVNGAAQLQTSCH